jgi:predicted nicotinamide N-methyase
MWSTVTAIFARIAGLRYVTPETMHPTRARETTLAIAANDVHPSYVGSDKSDNP